MQKFWQFINSSVHLQEEFYYGYFPELRFVPKLYTMAAVGSSLTPGGREELGEGFLCYRTAVCVFFPEVKPQNFSEVFWARIRF